MRHGPGDKPTDGRHLTSRDPMNEAETLAFMARNQLKPVQEFVPGHPLIYIFPQYVIDDMPPGLKSSLCLINNPLELDFTKPDTDENTGETVYALVLEGAVDFYQIIDRDTDMAVYTPSVSSKTNRREYAVRKEYIFLADRKLFPEHRDADK